jgi:hypothetical protein
MADSFILYLAVFIGRYLPFIQLAESNTNGRWPQ